jgi:hypothetical protein
MAIDGTWCIDCQLIDVSDEGAQIRMPTPTQDLEFVLLLTKFGNSVFRRCKRRWIRGNLMGVYFCKDVLGIKSLDERRREAEFV